MRTIHRTIVSALIISSDNKLLLGKKDPLGGGVYLDKWHIPGGGIEGNESFIEALQREVLEEVGIDIAPFEVVLVDDAGRGQSKKTLHDTGETVFCSMQFNIYRVEIDQPAHSIATKTSDDLVRLQWVSLAELAKLPLTPPSIELFKRLGYTK
jgi:8-oxo-dGTP diphosphatase